ncbi:MAG: hypothetical protein RSE56_00625 [Bacilli bacterium]
MNAITVFEISNESISMVVGYNVDAEKSAIIYDEKRYYEKLFKNDIFLNPENILSEIKDIIDNAAKKGIIINKQLVFFSLVPTKMIGKETSSITASSSGTDDQTAKITNSDILNLFNMAYNQKVSEPNYKIVEVVRTLYRDDKSHVFYRLPLNEVSKTAEMVYSYYCIPEVTFNAINELFKSLDIKIRKITLKNVAIFERIKADSNFPKKYILVDTFKTTTNISFCNQNTVYDHKIMNFGLSNLINEFSLKFDISEDIAKNILFTYGYDPRNYNFKVYVGEYTNKEGKVCKIYQSDVNNSIINFIKTFTAKLLEIKTSVTSENVSYIFVGVISHVPGVEKFIKEKDMSNIMIFYKNINVAFKNNAQIGPLCVIDMQSMYAEYLNLEKKNNITEPRFLLNRGE